MRYWLGYWLPAMAVGLALSRRTGRTPPGKSGAVVVLVPERIGDMVWTIPLLRAIRARFADRPLVVAVSPAAAPLVRDLPEVARTFEWRPGFRGAWQLGAELAREVAPEVVFVPRSAPDRSWSALVAVASGAARRVVLTERVGAVRRAMALQGWPHFTAAVRADIDGRHEIDRRLALAEGWAGSPAARMPEVGRNPADDAVAERFLAALPAGVRVAVGLGAAGPQRIWPAERFGACLDEWASTRTIVPVAIVGPEDQGRLAALRASTGQTVFTLPGATLGQSIAVLRGCDVFVGNDSGPAHLAAAVGLPVVVVSCHPRTAAGLHASSPSRCAPRGPTCVVVQPEKEAEAPCRAGCDAAQPHCILGVEAMAVADAVRPLLRSRVAMTGSTAKLGID